MYKNGLYEVWKKGIVFWIYMKLCYIDVVKWESVLETAMSIVVSSGCFNDKIMIVLNYWL